MKVARVGRRDTLGPGKGLGQPLLGDEAELIETRAEAAAVEDLMLNGLLQLCFTDDSAVAENPSQNRQKTPSWRILAPILPGR